MYTRANRAHLFIESSAPQCPSVHLRQLFCIHTGGPGNTSLQTVEYYLRPRTCLAQIEGIHLPGHDPDLLVIDGVRHQTPSNKHLLRRGTWVNSRSAAGVHARAVRARGAWKRRDARSSGTTLASIGRALPVAGDGSVLGRKRGRAPLSGRRIYVARGAVPSYLERPSRYPDTPV